MRTHSPAYRASVHPNNQHWTQLRWARYRHQHGRCAVCHLQLGMRWHLHHAHYHTLGFERLKDVRAVHPWPCHPLADSWRRLTNRVWRWWWSFYRASV